MKPDINSPLSMPIPEASESTGGESGTSSAPTAAVSVERSTLGTLRTPLTVDQIIEGVLEREGPGKPPYITPGDRGGRTSWGISERWHPEAWKNGPPTRDEAKQIYLNEYVKPWDWVINPFLKNQLVDYSVLHGLARAKYAMRQLGVDSLSSNRQGWSDPFWTMVNNALVAVRLDLIDRLTDEELSQKKFEEGWESRALRFLVLN